MRLQVAALAARHFPRSCAASFVGMLSPTSQNFLAFWFDVTQVELAASITMDANKPPKAITIRIMHPNSCSLKYDELDLKLRDMLNASGIEPKEPAEATEAEASEV